ncbi:MAG TPA: tRNA methyl transferase PRC-barrel domain-containing protein, partial [Thermomicrobiales bacterium]|nr:tRNA methyl transferase PRC-barrel domain-containing protein [Thermomicrobiales bacterium]
DQSYVLYTLDQDQLGFIQFPLGKLTKPEVRQLARAYGLPVADKAESQEICFVGNRSYADFVSERRPDVTVAGEIVTAEGELLGQHRGLVHHTVGQRRGIGIAAPKPYFVLHLDTGSNRLVVGSREEAEASQLTIEDVTLSTGAWPTEPFLADAVVRYRGMPTPARIVPGPAGSRTASLEFVGDRAPIASPGQAVVFYLGDQVLGGGTIQQVARRGRAA